MRNIGVILSGGSGSRFGGKVPKQYCILNGREVIRYTIEALRQSDMIQEIVIVMDQKEYLENSLQIHSVHRIIGGDTRNASLYHALTYIKMKWPDCEKVLIHEAARPFLKKEIVDTYLEKLDTVDAVITTQHITDSLGRTGQHVVDRNEYYLIQAPEAFRFQLLYENFSPESTITATSQQLPEGAAVEHYYDFENNMKITYPKDLYLAEHCMRMEKEDEEAI